MSQPITATIDRIEGLMAVLKLDDGQELKIDLNYLPAGLAEGKVVVLHFAESEDIEQERRRQAHRLLNQILKPD